MCFSLNRNEKNGKILICKFNMAKHGKLCDAKLLGPKNNFMVASCN